MWNKKYYHVVPQPCPVCKTNLGTRDPQILFTGKCSDCRATYYWQPWEEIPIATLDKDAERKRCGCLSCKALGR